MVLNKHGTTRQLVDCSVYTTHTSYDSMCTSEPLLFDAAVWLITHLGCPVGVVDKHLGTLPVHGSDRCLAPPLHCVLNVKLGADLQAQFPHLHLNVCCCPFRLASTFSVYSAAAAPAVLSPRGHLFCCVHRPCSCCCCSQYQGLLLLLLLRSV